MNLDSLFSCFINYFSPKAGLQNPFLSLPLELHLYILSLADPRDIAATSLVSRKWHLLSQESVVWKAIAKKLNLKIQEGIHPKATIKQECAYFPKEVKKAFLGFRNLNLIPWIPKDKPNKIEKKKKGSLFLCFECLPYPSAKWRGDIGEIHIGIKSYDVRNFMYHYLHVFQYRTPDQSLNWGYTYGLEKIKIRTVKSFPFREFDRIAVSILKSSMRNFSRAN